MPVKPSMTMPGTVEKIIEPGEIGQPEIAQIKIQEGAGPLYKEIRIENAFTDDEGKEVRLKQGAKVQVTVKANSSEIISK